MLSKLCIESSRTENIKFPKNKSKPIDISSPKKTSSPDLYSLHLKQTEFDPNSMSSSPPNMFMQNLHLRMDTYFDRK